ncbi:MAG: aconitate hydratase AcnA [Holophagales bacterium]|nr:aconitate hydratase AcnA [Holophagales bacterium]MYG30485.1 aconitate hydratase AcnA [Holophagales bacterium]MYI81531.1 aconitate hydratase AcnA [Holophagales bacterium]
MTNSFGAIRTMTAAGHSFRIAHLPTLGDAGLPVERLPYALKILLENLLRREDGRVVPADDIEAVARWEPRAEPNVEIAFMPGRVLLQDFTGVPAVADLAAMRDAMAAMGSDAARINPLQPAELVIDHSVQVDEYGSAAALLINAEREFERNEERYLFLRWGQTAFENFRVVPPATGIVHQVNLEYLARGVMTSQNGHTEPPFAYPDTLVGTDSHTTMINGLGVLGWGVGGIEAEAAMLGQPIAMLVPQVVGFRLVGALPEGTTATDLVLRVTEMLRSHGVVGKFVEFFGPGLAELRLADRATIANMAPEYGATCGIFPIDRAAIDYLRFTGRSESQVELVEAYCREQGLFHGPDTQEAEYSDTLELDLGTVEPSLAGPRRPQDRVRLSEVKESFLNQLPQLSTRSSGLPVLDAAGAGGAAPPTAGDDGEQAGVTDGSVVIAAITSCTNTSNPSVMLAAGLLAKNAVGAGLRTRPWVKTSLAPGSKVVTDYLAEAGLTPHLEELGFHTVGYGCTTCIGNSGPLPPAISAAIAEDELVAVSVLSGNRNFEGRISSEVRANYLASPPLVVAYALAGRIDVDLYNEPLASGSNGPVYLRDIWPAQADIQAALESSLRPEMFTRQYADVFAGSETWQALDVPSGQTFDWQDDSTYVKQPPFFVDMPRQPEPVEDIAGARVLALLGDTVTTDHISPAGPISPDSPAAAYLRDLGVERAQFNSYGARRGNHEVMMRGTFANVRLRNHLVPGVEGGYTVLLPEGEQMSIYDAAMAYRERGVPQIILAGLEYGTGSSRDWAAKGPRLLGVEAVIARSYERIHRSNLVGMGIAPLEFLDGEGPAELGLTGREEYAIEGLAAGLAADFEPGLTVGVRATGDDGEIAFRARVRLDTPQEAEYYRHAGILQYVLRQLLDDDA